MVRAISPMCGTQGYMVSQEGAHKLHAALSRSIEGHVDFMIGLVAMTTAQEDNPFRLGVLNENMHKKNKERSLIDHNLTTWLAGSDSDMARLVGDYYRDAERYDLVTGQGYGRAPDAQDFALQRTDKGWKVDDRTSALYYNVYRGYFFHPGCLLGLLVLFFILFLLFVILYSIKCRE